eukprot:CAMPEP_0175095798 /NCGR_PEP_ID=MMETSP0086_2-20121207/4368_1 /TAXON_ID=136419 /ORGANISM="Unknown Unknown, Strain D1" /LENGTH=232 /DNA_ID=CAMNT_0016369111 /DNA_START=1594 /DNA_END=2292 /DNA_ORIENTATION=+
MTRGCVSARADEGSDENLSGCESPHDFEECILVWKHQENSEFPEKKVVLMVDLVGVLIPGRTLITGFRQVDDKKLVVDVPLPGTVNEFAVVLLKPDIPVDHSLGIYYALPPFTEWQYLGLVNLERASTFFRAPWTQLGQVPGIQLGVSLEPTAIVKELQPSDQKEEEKHMDSAKGIAQDLFNYMQSFSQNSGQFAHLGNVLVLPVNCIDSWFKKFMHKHSIDPFFWMKKQAA